MSRPPWSIQTRLMAGLSLSTALLMGLIGWYWVQRSERALNLALDQRQERMAQMVARGFAEPVWNLDLSSLSDLLDAVMADPEVQSIELEAPGLDQVSFSRRRATPAAQTQTREVALLYRAGTGDGHELGRARLTYTRALVNQSLADTRELVISLLAMALLATLCSSYWLLRRLVERPVLRLSRLAGRVADGELGAQIEVEREDELGQLTRQLNAMSLRLKASAQELRDSEARNRSELEQLVAERTAELSQAMQRAEAASQAKSRFLAAMSHEFRTPLNAILGFAQLLQLDPRLEAQQQSRVRLIRDSGDHLLALITDLLDVASIEAGKLSLFPTQLDLRALLDMACDSVRLRATEKGLRFEQQFAPDLPSQVRADGQRLRQVLLNLLSNAIKFTDMGQVTLAVERIHEEPGLALLRFAVQDTGIGIAAEQLDRIFQPFEQVAEGRRRQDGTGLGLAISQQLVRLMGSEIEVRTQPGQGSRFTFTLSLPTPASG